MNPTTAVAAETVLADKPAETGIAGLFTELADQLGVIAFAALAVAIIIVGFKVMFAIRNGDNIREAVQNMGVVAIAALVVFGASGIAAALKSIGEAAGTAAGK